MNIIREPSVTLISRPVIDWGAIRSIIPNATVLQTNDGDALPEIAGRTCYQSWSGGRPSKEYLEHILESAHGSVLECAFFVFQIHGVSRSFSHELVRHRAGTSISQLSQRYVDESVAEYIEPDLIANCPEAHALWKESVQQSHEKYIQLVNTLLKKIKTDNGWNDNTKLSQEQRTAMRKEARQAARSVLPNATETKLQWGANIRTIRHVLEQRASRFAETEIRKFAYKLYQIMIHECPYLFEDYTATKLPDGTFELNTPYRKV